MDRFIASVNVNSFIWLKYALKIIVSITSDVSVTREIVKRHCLFVIKAKEEIREGIDRKK